MILSEEGSVNMAGDIEQMQQGFAEIEGGAVMTLQEKSELVRLLNLYQADLIRLNRKNIESGGNEYFVPGVKAQYKHARIISTKLSVELGKNMKTYWEV